MKMKKTWLSYPLWLLHTIMTGVLLAVYISACSKQIWGAHPYITAFLVAVVFAAVAGVWFVGHKAAEYLSVRFAGDKHLADMWECFLVMGLTASALLYRFRLFLHMDAVARGDGLYDMAIVKAGEGVPAMAHRASYAYTVCLSTVLSFTGNKAAAGIFFQLFLEIAVIVVLYAGIRMLTGRLEAVAMVAVMTFSKDFCGEMFRLTPEVFYLLLFALGILMLGMYAKRSTMPRFIILGMGIGWLGYLDLAGWILLLPGIYICVLHSIERQEKVWKRWRNASGLLGLALVVMLLLCGIDALSFGQSLGKVLVDWWGSYTNGQGIVFPAGPDRLPFFGIVICFMAAWAAFGFWFQMKQKQDVWLLCLVVFSILDMWNVGVLRYEIFLTAIWGVLAGIGISAMRVVPQPEDKQDNGVKEEEAASQSKLPLKELVVEEITMEDETPSVQLIENPLPLPKKHVKKEMDYDHFVDENDDYDI